MAFSTGVNSSSQASFVVTGSGMPTELMQILACDSIQPGSDIGYELCKLLFVYHPLGAKIAEGPIVLAQSQAREISIPEGPEEELKKAFLKEWKLIGKVGADKIIRNTMSQCRIYGITSLIVGEKNVNTDKPLDMNRIGEAELYFNVLDPLNTAGSLVTNQDPNAPDYQHTQPIRVGSTTYHPSRTVVMMNESPLFIQWENSAFGFTGRSVFQRALYPLKTFIQSMITDQAVTEKAALLVAKLESPESFVDKVAQLFQGLKRTIIKGAKTGNVLSIGVTEEINSLNMLNLEAPAKFARENCIKNIATAAGMPAVLLLNETMTKGFGEGTEDFKMVVQFIDSLREEMDPLYRFFDNIVMHRAWSPAFYETIQSRFPEYEKIPYDTAFYQWKNSFEAVWPSLLVEPDSEKAKAADVKLKAAIAVTEVLLPVVDQPNKAILAGWLSDVLDEQKDMISTPLSLDLESIASYEPPVSVSEPGEGTSQREPEKDLRTRMDGILHALK